MDSDNKFAEVDYSRVREEHYPPTIQKILKGMGDGRKRALFILLSFFKSLRMSDEQIQSKIDEWNKKNSEPLNPSYIRGQLGWYSKSKEIKLPPNFDKPYYKEIGIAPAEEELKAKNPLSYAVRKSFGSNFKKKDKK
jgi:DNA primase large subunit